MKLSGFAGSVSDEACIYFIEIAVSDLGFHTR